MFGPRHLSRAASVPFAIVFFCGVVHSAPALAKSMCAANETVAMQLSPGTKLIGDFEIPMGRVGNRPTQIEGGSATMLLSGATFVAGSGTQFYLTCYIPSDPARGAIPMFALAFGTITVSAPPNAIGEFGVLTQRLAGIGRAGSTWSMSWTAETATLTMQSGLPIEGAAATAFGGHAQLISVAAGQWMTVGPNQVITKR